MIDSGETALRRRRGNTFRQKDRIVTALCKVHRYAQGATCHRQGISQANERRHKQYKDCLCLFLRKKVNGGITMSNFDLPAAFEAFADARKAGFLKVKAAKEQGKKWRAVSVPLRPWRSWMQLIF